MSDKITLEKEFDKFFEKIKSNENFAFMRNADGERSIMLGHAVAAQEGNWKSPDYVSELGKAIYNSLKIVDEKAFYAISCPCCDRPAYYWYRTRIPSKNITFANLWINKNYRRFQSTFETISRDAILIANFRAEGKKIGNLNILKHYKIDDDCISFWENNAPQMLEKIKKEYGNQKNLLYVVSAGPMSGPIIAELLKNNPDNCYVDFGSSIDGYYRENISRPYMVEGSMYAERNCWMDTPQTTDFDVSVVMNLYKRPENLEIQLKAIEEQTLKPKEILLYQDGTSDTIKIPEDSKERFNLIEISSENVGVWGRFKFAQKAKSQYVCVFDDDTIPGKNWLENCHSEMLKQEGLYGTIGILLEENMKEYPKSGFFRVGWDGNLDKTVQVDFVGHSWFFKKSWLEYLFEETKELQKLKIAGEDIGFSFKLQQKGIKTFVPPHPADDKELWGSLPKFAFKLGTSKAPISTNTDGCKALNLAVEKALEKGFKPLIETDKKYIDDVKKLLKDAQKPTFTENIFSIKEVYRNGNPYKIIRILGFKISLKKS